MLCLRPLAQGEYIMTTKTALVLVLATMGLGPAFAAPTQNSEVRTIDEGSLFAGLDQVARRPVRLNVPANPFGVSLPGNPFGVSLPGNPFGVELPGNPFGAELPSNPFGANLPANPYI